jgi:uncharacterized protein YndB with AHSA1/START domain
MTEEKTDISVTRHVEQPVERVYDVWLDPAQARKFFFATATGQIVRAELDPRVGGKFVFTDRRDTGDVEHVGTYVELVRPKRIVFDFAVPQFSAQLTRIEVDVVQSGSGSDVTLTHRAVPPDHKEKARAGWTTILNNLADSLS